MIDRLLTSGFLLKHIRGLNKKALSIFSDYDILLEITK